MENEQTVEVVHAGPLGRFVRHSKYKNVTENKCFSVLCRDELNSAAAEVIYSRYL